MFDQNLIVFLDGRYLSLAEAEISPATHSLHYGTAVFEGIRAYNPKEEVAIFRLDDHIKRLFYSAGVMKMKIPFSEQELRKACLEVVKKNGLSSAYIRPLVFYDDASLGITTVNNKVRVLIMAWDWGKYLAESVRVKISSLRRVSEQSSVMDAKISGHYANSFLATMEVKKAGFDEALLLDGCGAIAEGPGENIFFVKGKKLYTPTAGKILPGITRNSVMSLAEDLQYEIIEKDIFPKELDFFEGAFFTGTAAEITPIESIELIDGKVIKFDVRQGEDIKKNFFDLLSGRKRDKFNWLTYVK